MEIFLGIMIPFFCTTIGSAIVFLVKEEVNDRLIRMFLALAAGIMSAASVFSLLLPALEKAKELRMIPWLSVSIGFMFGGLFLLGIDKLVPHLHAQSGVQEGIPARLKRTTMMLLAVTLHNVPEGMAVGLLYGMALKTKDVTILSSAIALSIGIGIQNIPEGAAVSLPMKKEGISNSRAFMYGTLSGIVEPIAALVAIFFVSSITGIMPWLLSFAAGSMIYVVVEELIPEAHVGEHNNLISIVFMIGFAIMMLLDVALG